MPVHSPEITRRSTKAPTTGWGNRWPTREPRPTAAKLAPEQHAKTLDALQEKLPKSKLLVALGVKLAARRGRFYFFEDLACKGDQPREALPKRIEEIELDRFEQALAAEGK